MQAALDDEELANNQAQAQATDAQAEAGRRADALNASGRDRIEKAEDGLHHPGLPGIPTPPAETIGPPSQAATADLDPPASAVPGEFEGLLSGAWSWTPTAGGIYGFGPAFGYAGYGYGYGAPLTQLNAAQYGPTMRFAPGFGLGYGAGWGAGWFGAGYGPGGFGAGPYGTGSGLYGGPQWGDAGRMSGAQLGARLKNNYAGAALADFRGNLPWAELQGAPGLPPPMPVPYGPEPAPPAVDYVAQSPLLGMLSQAESALLAANMSADAVIAVIRSLPEAALAQVKQQADQARPSHRAALPVDSQSARALGQHPAGAVVTVKH